MMAGGSSRANGPPSAPATRYATLDNPNALGDDHFVGLLDIAARRAPAQRRPTVTIKPTVSRSGINHCYQELSRE